MGLLALAATSARRIGEIGFIVGAIGGVLLALGAAGGNGRGASTARTLLVLAGVCIAVGFVLGIVTFHWGHL